MAGIITNLKDLGKSFEKFKQQVREPHYKGTGIYVHDQFRPEQLVKGDTFFDADYAEMVWNGKKWVSQISTSSINVEKKLNGSIVVSAIIDGQREKIAFQFYTKKDAISSFVHTYKIYFYDATN